eukprot:TRINITY_DN8390_c0_g1_i1.p1 TRINITY_DN8390_c0_g1~~TRINITY_DN8390_c0_g1_i1.p1  ORF type:complete len:439 (-),score=88.19 TRINITY_DN8390_c0_g1_i1:20-1336(-)
MDNLGRPGSTPDAAPDDMQSLGLFMDAVPFQTLTSISCALETRLENLSTSMFEPPMDKRSEPASPLTGSPATSKSAALVRGTSSPYTRLAPTPEERSRRAAQNTFITGVEIDEGNKEANLRESVPIKSVEDVRVDYRALLSGPRPPPNCDPAQLLQSVSDEIEFPKQWMRESWNKHFLSHLSLSIMQDMFWWFFNDEFALIQKTLGNDDGLEVKPMEPPPGHAQSQAVMFNRISDCYTRMFWKVGLTMLTDDFFERYAEALADAVREAFDRGLEESKHLFTDSANDRDAKLRDLIVQWTTAITPRRAQPKKHGVGRKNIRCGRFDAVGHSPLMASYMKRHACVAPIGGSGCKHNLHRLEVELRHDKVQWGNPKSQPAPVAARRSSVNEPPKPKMMNHSITVAQKSSGGGGPLPAITSTCGMGTFSQRKVDEVILGYLN